MPNQWTSARPPMAAAEKARRLAELEGKFEFDDETGDGDFRVGPHEHPYEGWAGALEASRNRERRGETEVTEDQELERARDAERQAERRRAVILMRLPVKLKCPISGREVPREDCPGCGYIGKQCLLTKRLLGGEEKTAPAPEPPKPEPIPLDDEDRELLHLRWEGCRPLKDRFAEAAKSGDQVAFDAAKAELRAKRAELADRRRKPRPDEGPPPINPKTGKPYVNWGRYRAAQTMRRQAEEDGRAEMVAAAPTPAPPAPTTPEDQPLHALGEDGPPRTLAAAVELCRRVEKTLAPIEPTPAESQLGEARPRKPHELPTKRPVTLTIPDEEPYDGEVLRDLLHGFAQTVGVEGLRWRAEVTITLAPEEAAS